jgi:hypothetical protein
VSYPSELEMYPDVVEWLRRRLADRYRRAEIEVRDTHAFPLNDYIRRNSLHRFFPSDIWQTYDIRVDVTGFVNHRGQSGLIFVECKNTPISLLDLSQLLGYSRVATPLHAYLLSSLDVGSAVRSLLLTYDRLDILEYHWARGRQPRSIVLGRFDRVSRQLDLGSVLPRGVDG